MSGTRAVRRTGRRVGLHPPARECRRNIHLEDRPLGGVIARPRAGPPAISGAQPETLPLRATDARRYPILDRTAAGTTRAGIRGQRERMQQRETGEICRYLGAA